MFLIFNHKIYLISIENTVLSRFDVFSFLKLVIPPKMIICSKDSPSDITVMLWFPILQSLLDEGMYLTLCHVF